MAPKRDELVSIFDVVYHGFLRTLSPLIDVLFRRLLSDLQANASTFNLDDFLMKFATTNIKDNPLYQKMIKNTVSFVTLSNSKPTEALQERVHIILLYLAFHFKKESRRNTEDQSEIIKINNSHFSSLDTNHSDFVSSIALLILADTITSLFIACPVEESTKKLISISFQYAYTPSRYLKYQYFILKHFQSLMYHISLINTKQLDTCFSRNLDEDSAPRLFTLIALIKADETFVENIVFYLTRYKKSKQITSDMLVPLATFFERVGCIPEVLSEVMNIAWSLKTNEAAKDGAITLITALFPRVNESERKVKSFYESRVYKHFGNDAKLERSLRAFLRFIRGDVSGLTGDPNSDPLFYIKTNQMNAIPLFLKQVYPKANASICPGLYCEVLLQVAASEPNQFANEVFKKLMELPPTDIRFRLGFKVLPLLANILTSMDRVCELARQAFQAHLKYFEEQIPAISKEFITTNPRSKDVENNNGVVSEFMEKAVSYESLTSTIAIDELDFALPFHLLYNQSDIENPRLFKFLLKCSISSSKLLSSQTNDSLAKMKFPKSILKSAISSMFEAEEPELQLRSLMLIESHIEYKTDYEKQIILAAFLGLGNPYALARVYSLNILRKLEKSQFYLEVLNENSAVICQVVKISINSVTIHEKLTPGNLKQGYIDYTVVAGSESNDLWLLFLASICDVLVETEQTELLFNLYEVTYKLIQRLSKYSELNFDPFVFQAITLLYGACVAAYSDTDKSQKVQNELDANWDLIFKSQNKKRKQLFISTSKYWNWRLIDYLLDKILTLDQHLMKYTTEFMTFIVQSPSVIQQIFNHVYEKCTRYLFQMNVYLAEKNLNSTRAFEITPELMENIDARLPYCINYCTIISSLFSQLTEVDENSTGFKQVLATHLLHWLQPDDLNEALKTNATNAFINLLNAGPLFDSDFPFHEHILDLLIERQMSGYDIFQSMLVFNAEYFVPIFVAQAIIKPKIESSLFSTVIENFVMNVDDKEIIMPILGSLLLFADMIGGDTIKQKIADICLKGGPYNWESFSFATEMVIQFALSTIRSNTSATVTKHIVDSVTKWFSKVRVLPTNRYIVQNIPNSCRRYTVIQFLDELSKTLQELTEEQSLYFTVLWTELSKQGDNRAIVFHCLFEIPDSKLKKRVFSHLLYSLPNLAFKYLAKRMSFAYWLFAGSQDWIFDTIAPFFNQQILKEIPYRVSCYVFHFSLLYIEQHSSSIEKAYNLLEPEVLDDVISLISSQIDFQLITSTITQSVLITPELKHEWALEALRWVVACKDDKLATRSAQIFLGLSEALPEELVPLIIDAIAFHFQSSEFVTEMLRLINANYDSFEKNVIPICRAILKSHLSDECRKEAMPLLRRSKAIRLIPLAFAPFVPQLEYKKENQLLLKDLLSEVPLCEIHLFASIFTIKPLEFLRLEYKYETLIAENYDSQQADYALQQMNTLLKTASLGLRNAIFFVANELLKRFTTKLAKSGIVAMFYTAMHHISESKESLEFVTTFSSLDMNINEQRLEDSSSHIADVPQEITQLQTEFEPVPVTDCKAVVQLRGILSGTSKPRVIPYSNQHEMVNTLRQAPNIDTASRQSRGRFQSMRSLSLLMMVNKTPPSTNQADFSVQLDLGPLNEPVLKKEKLNLPEDSVDIGFFLLNQRQFTALSI